MFKTYKRYKSGGEVLIHPEVVRKQADYKDLLSIAHIFAKEGKTVKLNPKVHFKSDEYKEIYGYLRGTVYDRKCPDLSVNGIFYEYESFIPPFKKGKISNMIRKGTVQSSRIIINNSKGASDRYIRDNIYMRIKDKTCINEINEVWLYEKGKLRLLFKKQ